MYAPAGRTVFALPLPPLPPLPPLLLFETEGAGAADCLPIDADADETDDVDSFTAFRLRTNSATNALA
jgi:hypothetical protein